MDITALGGGITRDILIQKGPPLAFLDIRYLLVALGAGIVACCLASVPVRTCRASFGLRMLLRWACSPWAEVPRYKVVFFDPRRGDCVAYGPDWAQRYLSTINDGCKPFIYIDIGWQ
jgi:hypothetical protein